MVGTPDPSGSPEPGGPAPSRPGSGDDLVQLVLSTPTIEEYLDELVRRAEALDPVLAGCGVTLRRDGHVLSVATSSALAAHVDEVQYGLGSGPCLDSLASGEVIAVPDTAEETRWDGYPEHALLQGVRSSLSLPLRVDGAPLGALNCYASSPHAFGRTLSDRLSEFAERAQLALALALHNARQADVVDQLHRAMQSRSVIDQALGIIMARQRCTAEDAFAVLRAASQSRNRKVADIAAELISSTTGAPARAGRFET